MTHPTGVSGAHALVDLATGLAAMRTGMLLSSDATDDVRQRLSDLAAAVPELLGSVEATCIARIREHLGSEGGESFQEVLLMSGEHVHVILPLERRPGVVLVTVCPATVNVGLVLSAVRARAAEIEAG